MSILTFIAFIFLSFPLTIPNLVTLIPWQIIITPFYCFGYTLLFNTLTFISGYMHCLAMVIHWQGTVTQGFFIIPADGKAWASSKSHLPLSWNGMYIPQVWPKGPYLWNWWGLLFLPWVSCKYTKHQHRLFSQVHSWNCPHHNKPILQKFMWHLPLIPLFSLSQIWSRYHWCNLKACWGTVRFHWHLLL